MTAAEAKVKFVGTMRTAGLVQPHAGHEQVILAALDEFEREILQPVVDKLDAALIRLQGPQLVPDPYFGEPEVAGSSSDKYGDEGFAGDGDPYDFAEYMADSPHAKAAAIAAQQLPTADDLDAVAAEQQAKEATSGEPVVETKAPAAETELPVAETEPAAAETQEAAVEPA